MAVADFYNQFMQRLRRLGIDIDIWTMPGEIENAIPFDRDRIHAQYDPIYAQKFWLALVQASRVMNEFRARFIGKASPVHFFWGSFDLAVTRFSGRPAPPPKGVTPNVASWVLAEAYSHEVSSSPAPLAGNIRPATQRRNGGKRSQTAQCASLIAPYALRLLNAGNASNPTVCRWPSATWRDFRGQRLQRQQGYGENLPRRGNRANDSNRQRGDETHH